jgi:hypothetical protein
VSVAGKHQSRRWHVRQVEQSIARPNGRSMSRYLIIVQFYRFFRFSELEEFFLESRVWIEKPLPKDLMETSKFLPEFRSHPKKIPGLQSARVVNRRDT